MPRSFLDPRYVERFMNLVGPLEPRALSELGKLGLSQIVGEAAESENAQVMQTLNILVAKIKAYNDTYRGIPTDITSRARSGMFDEIGVLARELSREIEAARPQKWRIPYSAIITTLLTLATLYLMYLGLPGNWKSKDAEPAVKGTPVPSESPGPAAPQELGPTVTPSQSQGTGAKQ